MGSQIRILEDTTINQIAAGEVVENPASVVKELVENALDAQASLITVEVRAGGFQQIRVSDNGIGMNPDDVLLSLERHATSKIKKIQDLLSLSSMGFRGEALASIASISKFTVETAIKNPDHQGTKVFCEGSQIKTVENVSRQQGTTVDVKSLFFNVPARKKFQKSPPMALAEISKLLNTLALSRPDVEFKFFCEGKLLLHAKNNQNLPNKEAMILRAIDVLGKTFVEDVKYVKFSSEEFTIEGLLGSPKLSKVNRLHQHLFINTRSVVSKEVSFAVEDGYASMIPERRFPMFLLYLKMPAKDVDVNVHPQKREVKFKSPVELKAFIRKAVGQTLDKTVAYQAHETVETSSFGFFPKALRSETMPVYQQNVKEFKKENSKDILPETTVIYESSKEPFISLDFEKAYIGLYEHFALFRSVDLKNIFQSELEGILLINLKSLQQRLHYQRVLSSLESSKLLEREASFFPEKVTFSKTEAQTLLEYEKFLLKIGIEIRPFGEDVFVIESISPLYEIQDVKDFLYEITTGSFVEKDTPSLVFKEKLAQRAASLAVSKAKLQNKTNALALIHAFFSQTNVEYSFKGEPVIKTLSYYDIEKLFRK